MAWGKTSGADRPLRVHWWARRLGHGLGVVSSLVIVELSVGLFNPAGPVSANVAVEVGRTARAERSVPALERAAPAVPAPIAILPTRPSMRSTSVPSGQATPPKVAPPVPALTPVGSPTASVPTPTSDGCVVALGYLAAHAAPGFAHFCRPGDLHTALGPAAGYTCVPGTGFSCPDGIAEIIIAEPTCAASYENEASNSHWNLSAAGVVMPGTVQNGRAWDPFGSCPAF